MKKITAFQCEKCEKLFRSEDEFNKHYKQHLDSEQMAAELHSKQEAELKQKQRLIDMVANSGSITELEHNLEEAVREWARLFPKEFDKLSSGGAGKATNIKLNVSFFENVSNALVCPNNGGVTNFSIKPELPTGYPGFRGHIQFFSKDGYANTNILSKLGVKTGSGGGGGANTNYQYGVSIFLADFPKLAELVQESQETMKKLKSHQDDIDKKLDAWVSETGSEGEIAHSEVKNQLDAIAQMEKELRSLEAKYRAVLDKKRAELDAGVERELVDRLNEIVEKLV